MSEKQTRSFSAVNADFTHWSKMPYWSIDEGIALLLDKNPQSVYWDLMKNYLTGPHANPFALYYSDLRDIALRALEMQEITDPTSPITFVAWAEGRGIEIPETLQQEIAIRKSMIPVGTEAERLLKIKDDEITVLQKRTDTLEALVWKGFDETASTYAKELAIAVRAHDAVSKNWKKGSSIKKQIAMWLKENYPKLFNEELERISKICNWQKTGGAPPTP